MIKEVDIDGDGEINFEEFKALISNGIVKNKWLLYRYQIKI